MTRTRFALALLVIAGLILLTVSLLSPHAESVPPSPTPKVAEESASTRSTPDSRARVSVPTTRASENDKGATQPVTRPTVDSAKSPPGRIYGNVLAPDGQPAVNRDVRILSTPGGTVTHATTDQRGFYDQRGLAPARYHVSTQPTPEELKARGLTTRYNGLEWLAQRSVVLDAAEEVRVDLGFPPDRPIRVFGRVRGDVESALLQWSPEDDQGYNLSRYVPTRADGTYEVQLRAPGPYHISTLVSPGSFRIESDVIVPDTTEFEHDILLPVGRIVVTVRDASGTSIRGAIVDFVPRSGITPIPGMSSSSFSQRTSAEGKAELGHVRAGEWFVAVHDAARNKESPLAAAHALVSVSENGRPAEVSFELKAGKRATGRVLDAAGTPCANANLHAFDAAGEPMSPLRAIQTNKAGEFELGGLAPGSYALVALLGDRASSPVTFTLREGEPMQPLELRVAPAARLVVARTGLTAPAWIEVRDQQGNLFSALLDWNLFNGGNGRAASTVASWYCLPSGNYTIRALGQAGVLKTATAALTERESRRIEF